MAADQIIARLRSIFDAFTTRGDASHLLECLTEETVYQISIGPGTPVANEYVGKEAITEYFRGLPANVQHISLNIHDYFANDQKGVVTGDETLRIVKDGTVFYTQWATIFTFDGDKITHVMVVENLGALSQAYGVPHAGPPSIAA
ncbi:nuclear transport factor 2 family protein [Chondromyces crocatus]|uniref:SnoaL-like domain-containing protein n=1 Tax=Chondromyces crocatus TaxID=52 RepID=A0A0K1EPV5_CHOCO|nr:nuclear transport factor 2 family protein [Chondromyces crocatus]AKT42960.1 uncharacterized protein CMC5_071880 [Chondromyces crocatus]